MWRDARAVSAPRVWPAASCCSLQAESLQEDRHNMALEPGQALFCKSRATPVLRGPRVGLYARYAVLSKQTQNICITFVQCWINVEDVGPTLYKCYTNVFCGVLTNQQTRDVQPKLFYWANVDQWWTSIKTTLVQRRVWWVVSVGGLVFTRLSYPSKILGVVGLRLDQRHKR